MRLIDADALMDRMYHEAFETDTDMQKWDSGCWIRYKMFENAIDEAPTIDADRPKGKWHHIQSVCYGGGTMKEVVCSKCHEHYILPTNFCPYCGADMRKREGE